MKRLKIDWSKNKPIITKKLNFFGSFFLLISFTIQMFLYNSWDDKTERFNQANRDFTELTRTSLEYQNLYLSLHLQDSITRQKFQTSFIKAAATKYHQGKIISTNLDLFQNEDQVKEFVNNSNQLKDQIHNIDDMNSLYNFVKLADKKIPINQKLKITWMKEMKWKKDTASFIFLTFQILGSIMLVLGYRYQS